MLNLREKNSLTFYFLNNWTKFQEFHLGKKTLNVSLSTSSTVLYTVLSNRDNCKFLRSIPIITVAYMNIGNT